MRGERLVPHLLVALVGATVLAVSAGDDYLAYVQPVFRSFLLAAGAVLVVIGAGGLLRRDRPATPHDAHHASDGHGGHLPPVSWLLLLPVAVLLLVGPPALGSFTASRQSQPVAIPDDGYGFIGPDDEGEDHRTMTVRGYAVAALIGDPGDLEGRRVRLTGFVTPGEEGGWYVTRFSISCCAADAVAVSVVVDGPQGELAADQWVEVIGEYAPPRPHPSGGYREAVVVPVSVTPVDAPADTYQ